MVFENGVGADIDGEYASQLPQPVNDPLFPMFVDTARERILPAQKGAAQTTRHAVVEGGVVQADLLLASAGHEVGFVGFARKRIALCDDSV